MIKKFSLLILLTFLSIYSQPCCDSSCNFHVSAAALYWKADEDGLDYMIKNSNGASLINDGKVIRMDFDWDWGFKVGIGYQNPCCCAGLEGEWTRFYSDGDDSVSTAFPEALFPVWTNPSTSLTTEEQASASVCLRLDKVDLLVSSEYCPSSCFSIFPKAGLSFANIDQRFEIHASDGVSMGPFAIVLDDAINMKNDFWGIGPLIGMETLWSFRCISFFANINFSILYGCFDITQNETVLFTNNVPETTYLDINDNTYSISRPSINLIIGFRYDTSCLCKDDLTIEAGWEHLYFF